MRDIIHSDNPFTIEEDAAAWILLGRPAEEALATAANMNVELATSEGEAGVQAGHPRASNEQRAPSRARWIVLVDDTHFMGVRMALFSCGCSDKRFVRLKSNHLDIVMAAFLLAGLAAQPVSAQVATTVRGMVRDAGSNVPVAGALVAIGARQALTSSDGSFRLLGSPFGEYRLRVEAFGYRTHEEDLRVVVGMEPIEIELEPDPIQLQEVTVSGNARAPLRGVVLNARSGEPIPWTDLTLTRGATQQVGRREASDEQGVFEIANVAVGEYLLRVDRLGFESQYVPISHGVPAMPVDVRLEPDADLLRGIAVMSGELHVRRDGHSRAARVFDETELRRSRASGMRHFLEAFTSISLTQCERPARFRFEERDELEARSMRRNCVRSRGGATRPRLFIDEVAIFDPEPPSEMRSPLGTPGASSGDSLGPPPPPPPPDPISIDVLNSYDPRDFYLFEHFECEDGVIELHVYTYQYIQRMALRPSVPVPVCLPR